MRILTEIDSIEFAQPILSQLLHSEHDVVVRIHAAQSIGRLGLLTEEGRTALQASLADDSLDVRLAAAECLSASIASDEAVCRVLREALKRPDPYYQAWAARIASTMFERARPLLAELRDAIASGNSDQMKLYITSAVLSITEDSRTAVPILEELLNSEDLWIAAKAAERIGELGTAGIQSAQSLRVVISKREDDYLRLHIACALWRVTNERKEAFSILKSIEESTSGPRAVRAAAIELMKKIG